MAKNGHAKPARKKGSLFTYRTYNFVDKDPVIDRIRTIIHDEGLSYSEIHTISGVASATLHNWFEGGTRRPQYATIAAVTSSLGYKQEFVKSKKLDFEKEIAKAKKEIEDAANTKR
jgi:transcriptional regulator with XRE-family HTH domain